MAARGPVSPGRRHKLSRLFGDICPERPALRGRRSRVHGQVRGILFGALSLEGFFYFRGLRAGRADVSFSLHSTDWAGGAGIRMGVALGISQTRSLRRAAARQGRGGCGSWGTGRYSVTPGERESRLILTEKDVIRSLHLFPCSLGPESGGPMGGTGRDEEIWGSVFLPKPPRFHRRPRWCRSEACSTLGVRTDLLSGSCSVS